MEKAELSAMCERREREFEPGGEHNAMPRRA
jgi:hypothetical protein